MVGPCGFGQARRLTDGALAYGETAGLRQLYRRRRLDPTEVLTAAYCTGGSRR